MQQKAKRLEEEMLSLRDAYARKIANTELKCERLLREKDDERDRWYKEKKLEIARMQASVTIMQALFEKKRRRIQREVEGDKEDFERHKFAFEEHVQRLHEEHEQELERLSADHAEEVAKYEATVAELHRVVSELEADRVALQDRLQGAQTEVGRWQEENTAQRHEIEELRRRLIETERTEELARRNSQIEALQQELRRLKKQMLDKRNAEAEALRKELMEYVKFIVHILPEDWQQVVLERGAIEEPRLLAQLEERPFAAAQSSSGWARKAVATSEHGEQAPAGHASLPPVSAGSGFGYATAYGGAPSTASAGREHRAARTSDAALPLPAASPRRRRPLPQEAMR